MYKYVGPADIREDNVDRATGTIVRSRDQLIAWIADTNVTGQPVTFVVALDGDFVVAPRESEHVAAAAGRPVLSAGEVTFDSSGTVLSITNQSTGYCPEPRSWLAVAYALDQLGVIHPGSFTTAFEFRRCSACASINLVKDDDYVCSVCEASLPIAWNLGS